MKLLLDEMLSHRIAQRLRSSGHDVAATVETPGWRAADDSVVFALAQNEQRAVVTNNIADYLSDFLRQPPTTSSFLVLI